MNKQEVIDYFGEVKIVAKLLDISSEAVYQWEERIPKGSACELHVITEGALKVDISLYPKKKTK